MRLFFYTISTLLLSVHISHAQQSKVVEVPTLNPSKSFAGVSKGIIFDAKTGQIFTVELPVPDDASGPAGDPKPVNGADFSFPIQPPNQSLAKLTVLLGSDLGSCVATAVGDRSFVTAAHCVYNKDGAGNFYPNVKVLPGHVQGSTPLTFPAAKIVVFNGYTEGGDSAHDVAFVTIASDLPPSIKRYKLGTPSCTPPYPGVDLYTYEITNFEYKPQLRVTGDFVPPRGCHYGMYWHMQAGPHGTSGSASINGNDEVVSVYAGRMIGSTNFGLDARLTRAKVCFLHQEVEGKPC